MSNVDSNYRANPNLKKTGVQIQFTEDQVQEIVKCSNDPVYFAAKYIKIISLDHGIVPFEMYDFQKDMIRNFQENRYNIVKCPRRVGKSTVSIAFVLWLSLFNANQNIVILANKEKLAQKLLYMYQLAYENLPIWMQQGIKEWNKTSVELENGSIVTSAPTSSSGVRGEGFNLVLLDEFAFVPNNIAENFYTSVYPVITSGKTTKIIITSTPNGMNLFYKLWTEAITKKNNYTPFNIHWSLVPGRDEQWKEEFIKNTSLRQWSQEMECVSGNTIIELENKEGKLVHTKIKDFYEYLGPNQEFLYSRNTDYKVKTSLGYEYFAGVKKSVNRKLYTVFTQNGFVLDCTEEHKLKTPAGWMELRRLTDGDVIETVRGDDKIIAIKPNVTYEDVFDLINAGEKRSYFTNGILSHNCEFLGSSNTLISGEKIGMLTYREPIGKYFNMLVYDDPVKETFDDETGKQLTTDHLYAMTVDVAEGKNLDYSAFSVFDISVVPYKQVAVYRNNEIAPILFPTVIKHCAEYYNNAHVLIEINNSPQVAQILQEDLEYENVLKVTSGNKKGQTITLGFGRNVAMGLKMTPLVKRNGCSSLKTLIENDKLIIQDFETYSELTTFIQTGPSFAAEEGCNDDLAMTLVIFAWLAVQKLFKEIVDHDIRKQLQLEHFEFAEEDQLPTGEYNMGFDTQYFIEDGTVWIETNNKSPYDSLLKEMFDF